MQLLLAAVIYPIRRIENEANLAKISFERLFNT